MASSAGRVYIAAGATLRLNSVMSIEVYDPHTRAFFTPVVGSCESSPT